MSKAFNPRIYVTKTPGGNIGIRDSVSTEYFHITQYYQGPDWAPDGFSPELARKLATEINRLADEIEEEAREPKIENWPPQENDLWSMTIAGNRHRAYYIHGGFRLVNRVTGQIEGDLTNSPYPSLRTLEATPSADPKLEYRLGDAYLR